MGAVDFDGLSRGVEYDFAVAAAAQVSFEFGARIGSHGAVDQVVEKGEKLFAGHFSTPVFPKIVSTEPASLGLASLERFFLWK